MSRPRYPNDFYTNPYPTNNDDGYNDLDSVRLDSAMERTAQYVAGLDPFYNQVRPENDRQHVHHHYPHHQQQEQQEQPQEQQHHENHRSFPSITIRRHTLHSTHAAAKIESNNTNTPPPQTNLRVTIKRNPLHVQSGPAVVQPVLYPVAVPMVPPSNPVHIYQPAYNVLPSAPAPAPLPVPSPIKYVSKPTSPIKHMNEPIPPHLQVKNGKSGLIRQIVRSPIQIKQIARLPSPPQHVHDSRFLPSQHVTDITFPPQHTIEPQLPARQIIKLASPTNHAYQPAAPIRAYKPISPIPHRLSVRTQSVASIPTEEYETQAFREPSLTDERIRQPIQTGPRMPQQRLVPQNQPNRSQFQPGQVVVEEYDDYDEYFRVPDNYQPSNKYTSYQVVPGMTTRELENERIDNIGEPYYSGPAIPQPITYRRS